MSNDPFIKLGLKWKYRTNWRNGSNLFPDIVCSIDILRLTPHAHYHKGGKNYFKKAFSNPIQIRG